MATLRRLHHIIRECSYCGGRLEGKQQRFCTSVCRDNWWARRTMAKRRKQPGYKEPPRKPCEDCGKKWHHTMECVKRFG